MIALSNLTPASLDPYIPVVALAGPLEGATLEMVNSTAVGGGVTELLTRLLPLMRGVGWEGHWHVMEAGPEFFEAKNFHNALRGSAHQPGLCDFEIFREHNRRNRELPTAS
jgi:trehalose synthase